MYNFAANKMKLQRAIASVGSNASEEQIYAEYVKIGGLLANEYKIMEPEIVSEVVAEVVPEMVEAPVVADEKKEEISSEESSVEEIQAE